MNYVNITILQRPTEVEFECPYCGETTTIDYDEFTDDLGTENPTDWYGSFFCPECHKELEVADVEWS